MFGKFRKNKENNKLNSSNYTEDLQVQYIKELVERKKLPLIILDPLWYEIKEFIQIESLEEHEKILNELLKERAKLNTETLEYEKVKHNLLDRILELSQDVQEEKSTDCISELEKVRQTVLKSKEILKQHEKRLEELEILIQKHNTALVKEVVAHGYCKMEEYRKQKENLEDEIEELRKQVLIKTEEKKKYDKEFGIVYNYLHKMIGFQYIDEVDKKLGETKA